jgi:hypothetical protein
MENIINDVKSLFNRAKIFLRATTNKILSSKSKVDEEIVIREPSVISPEINKNTETETESKTESESSEDNIEKV